MWLGSYEELELYLRNFTNIGGDPAYDTHGILNLMLSLADNLRETDGEHEYLRELSEYIAPEQVAFLKQLVNWAEEHQRHK